MSEAEQQQATDILLPAARVIVFSRDAETLASARGLLQDWRFSRVDIRVIEGDTQSAVALFANEGRSPDLVIIQTDNIDEGFTEQLGELSNYCDEGTAAVIVGPVNDVYLYRRLIDMGVSDYLVRPIHQHVLTQVVSKALITKFGFSGSALVGVMGAKGGVGTSVIAQVAAVLASGNLEHKTMLLDASGGQSTSSVGIGFDPAVTLPELAKAVEMNNEEAIKRVTFIAGGNLSVIAGGSDAILDPSITAEQFEKIITKLMVKYPLVIVDLSCAPAALKRVVVSRSNRIVLVTAPTVTSLRFARSLLKEIGDVRGGDRGNTSLVVNFHGISKSHEVPQADIGAALDHKPAGFIPYNPAAFLGAEADIEQILKDKDAGEALRRTLLPILKSALGAEREAQDGKDKKSGLIGGFLTKLTSK